MREWQHSWRNNYILKYFLLFNFIGQSDDTETDNKGEMEDTRSQGNSDKLKEELPLETREVPEGSMYEKKLIEGIKIVAKHMRPSTIKN